MLLRFIVLTAIAACIATVAVRAAELKLKPLGELHQKPLGSAMVFTCEVTIGDDDPDDAEYRLQWFDTTGREITDKTGRRYVEEESNVKKLYITDIDSTDDGTYKCIAPDIQPQPMEKTVILKLYKEITFESADSPQHPRIYSDALIRCVVSGPPELVVSWRYKGQRISIGGRSRYTDDRQGLYIANITTADDGDYTCRAEVETDGKYDEKKITVKVHIPPAITEGPGNVEGIEGDEVTISCRATAMPPPDYVFYKGDIMLESGPRVQVNNSGGVVRFKPLMKSDEDKLYNCTAVNDVGSDSAVGELKVLVRPSVTKFDDVIQEERKTATLVCQARGDPVPKMSFRKVGSVDDYQPTGNEDSRVSVTEAGDGRLELVIANVGPQDAGDYQCAVSSSVGQNSSTAKLTVEYKPFFAADHIKTEHVWSGKTRNVTCSPSAEPQAVVEWTKGDVILVNNGTYRLFSVDKTSILQVTVREQDQSWIYGEYRCVARNRLGTGEIDIELKRASVPDAPKSVSTKSRTPTAVVISVEPPEDDGGMPILGYRVDYNDVSYDFSSVSTSDGDEDGVVPPYNTLASGTSRDVEGNEIEIDNLKPSTTYVLRIKAKNEVGNGIHAYKYNVTTEDIRKPYPLVISSPRNGQSAFNYHVTWNKPNDGGRPIISYEFSVRRVKVAEGATTDSVPVENGWRKFVRDHTHKDPMMQFTIQDLEPDSHYQLRARARNDVDWSDYSPHFVFHTAPATEAEIQAMRQSSTSAGLIVVIVIVLLAAVLIALDLACFFINKRGIIMILRKRFGPTVTTRGTAEKEIEDGEKEHLTANNDEQKAENQEKVNDVAEKTKVNEIDETNDATKAPEGDGENGTSKVDETATEPTN